MTRDRQHHYRIGQALPAAQRRVLLGEACPPVWYALLTRPNRESAARAWMAQHDVESWFPVEPVWMRDRQGRRVERMRRLAPGYLFARFERAPVWHMLLVERPGALYLSGVLVHRSSGLPAQLREDSMARLMSMPRLAGAGLGRALTSDVRAGDRIEITRGPFAGFDAVADRVQGGLATVVLSLFGRQTVAELDLAVMRRVA